MRLEIPISCRDFKEMNGMAAAGKTAANTAGEPGIVSAAAWGLSHKIAANEIKWDVIPAEKRSYLSAERAKK